MEDIDSEIKGDIEPAWEKRFSPSKITKIIESITDDYLRENKYTSEYGTQMSLELSKKIRDKMKDKLSTRYKTSVQVFLGEKKMQKVTVLAKGFWDSYVDNYAIYNWQDDESYCTVIVFGFYTD